MRKKTGTTLLGIIIFVVAMARITTRNLRYDDSPSTTPDIDMFHPDYKVYNEQEELQKKIDSLLKQQARIDSLRALRKKKRDSIKRVKSKE